MDCRKVLGHNVRRLRRKAKLTQEELAELVGNDPSQLQRIEYGKSWLLPETLNRLCSAFKVNVSDLFKTPRK